MSIDAKRVAPLVGAAVIVGALALQLIFSLKPAAANDHASACRGLEPSENAKMGPLPVLAPDFHAMDYRGKEVPLSAFRGKVVFLNFWSTTCEPCITEMPSMERLQARFGDQLVVLALASHRSFLPVRRFFPDGTGMTPLLDPPKQESMVGEIGERFGISGWPETYLIDKRGNLRYYFVDARNWNTPRASQCIRSLIDED